MPARSILLGSASVVSVGLLVGPPPRQPREPPCDKTVQALALGPNGYGPRGDRCEGIYVQPVSGSSLWLASLTRSFELYDFKSGADLTVAWSAPGKLPFRLLAQGIRADLYYRMDAVSRAAAGSYRWPSDLLAAERIPQQDIGVLGWTRYSLGGVERELYAPLSITQHRPAAHGAGYDLVLYPTVELVEVYLSVTALDSVGRPKKRLQQGKPLKYRYYPAEEPVHVPLTGLDAAGVYLVEIGAALPDTSSATLAFWVYHAAEGRGS